MLGLLIGILVAFVSTALAFSYAYFLQCRLLRHQVKEKNIDSLLEALDKYEKLTVDYWGGNLATPHLVEVRQKVFSDLVYHIGGEYGLDSALRPCLSALIMRATGSNYPSTNHKPNHEQQRLIVKYAGELRLIIMKNRYAGWRLGIQEVRAKIKQQLNL